MLSIGSPKRTKPNQTKQGKEVGSGKCLLNENVTAEGEWYFREVVGNCYFNLKTHLWLNMQLPQKLRDKSKSETYHECCLCSRHTFYSITICHFLIFLCFPLCLYHSFIFLPQIAVIFRACWVISCLHTFLIWNTELILFFSFLFLSRVQQNSKELSASSPWDQGRGRGCGNRAPCCWSPRCNRNCCCSLQLGRSSSLQSKSVLSVGPRASWWGVVVTWGQVFTFIILPI